MLRTFAYDIDKMTGVQVWLGYTKENEATQIRIDISRYLEQYPNATATLLVKNPIGDLYPAAINISDGTIIWNVNSADTVVPGIGQLAVTVSGQNGEIVKSARIDTILRISLDNGDAGESPDAYQTWLDKLLAAAEGVKTMSVVASVRDYGSGCTADYDADTCVLTLGIERGKSFTFDDFTPEELESLTESISAEAADKAAKATLEFVKAAEDAKDAAVIAKEKAETSERNAEISASRAEMAADEAGWFWLEHENGILYYVRSDSLSDDFKLEDDGSGRLIAIYV